MDYLIERYFSLLKILYVNQYTGAAPLVRQLFLQLSALMHIHNRGIVHRDIKPDNIMLSIRDADRFFLIDYGIARPYRTGTPNRYNPIEDGRHVVGTLTWASLNAHGGYGKRLFQLQRLGSQFTFANRLSDLSRRDDLESLAYTLLFLLRGSLPWQRSPSESSTLLVRMAQVREKKRAWTGAGLGEGFPDPFGQLLDYSRALGFDENPDYTRFWTLFDDFSQGISFSRETFGGSNTVACSTPTCEHSISLLIPTA